jgi:hypothetical protein
MCDRNIINNVYKAFDLNFCSEDCRIKCINSNDFTEIKKNQLKNKFWLDKPPELNNAFYNNLQQVKKYNFSKNKDKSIDKIEDKSIDKIEDKSIDNNGRVNRYPESTLISILKYSIVKLFYVGRYIHLLVN